MSTRKTTRKKTQASVVEEPVVEQPVVEEPVVPDITAVPDKDEGSGQTSRHFLVTTNLPADVVSMSAFLECVKNVAHVRPTDPEMESAIELAKSELKAEIGGKIVDGAKKLVMRELS